MTEFAYNNVKNTSTAYTLFKLNYEFHLRVSKEEDVNPRSKSKTANHLALELYTLMFVYRENLQHTQKLQNHYHDKHVKPRSYSPGYKI